MKPIHQNDLSHVLEKTEEIWRQARGETFLITGGTGFFGVWLLETFLYINNQLGLNANAVVVSRNPNHLLQKAPHLRRQSPIKWVTDDVRNFNIKINNARFVVHAATATDGNISQNEILSVIVEGTQHVLEKAKTHGAQKILYISSGAVYGPQPANLKSIPEDYTGLPNQTDAKYAYGCGKRQAEALCFRCWEKGGPEPVIARGFAFVGAHLPLNAQFAIGNLIRDALSGGPLKIQGDGTAVRSYLYAADLAIWLWTMLLKGQAGRIYNVGSSEALSIKQLASHVNRIHGGELPIIISKPPTEGMAPSQYIPDITRAQREIGLRQYITLDEAIYRTSCWYQ